MAAPMTPDAVVKEMLNVRQVRQYLDQPVSDDIVETLLDVARWSGSSQNLQPWQFIIIKNKDKLRQISELRKPISWLSSAPLAIAIVLDGDYPNAESFDSGRLTERILIAAHFLGLGAGTAWFGGEEPEKFAKNLLGIPENRTAEQVVAIGYYATRADPRGPTNRSGRKPLADLIHYEKFGNHTPV